MEVVMLRWLTSRLPKRVIKKGIEYYPQIWFLWWHYNWESISYQAIAPCGHSSMADAIKEAERVWGKREPKPKEPIQVVWRGK